MTGAIYGKTDAASGARDTKGGRSIGKGLMAQDILETRALGKELGFILEEAGVIAIKHRELGKD